MADRNTRSKVLWRAGIVLATADGLGTVAIMRRTGKSKPCVWRWQERYVAEGVEGLLRDKTRPARAARPLLRPGTRFRPACHQRARRAPPSLSLRSFFEGLLGRWIGLRVLRANGEAAEVQPPKQLAHAALVQGDAKLGRDAVTQIGTAEPHHAVAGEIGALLDPGCKLALFNPAQARWPAASRPVRKPIQTGLIIAVNPVAQRLTVHPTEPRRLLAAEAIEHHRNGQDARR